MLLMSGCTVYKSEGKKGFESATNEYGDRLTASEKMDQCSPLDPQTAQELIEQIESGSPLPEKTKLVYTEDDQTYWLCSLED